jgi:cyclase
MRTCLLAVFLLSTLSAYSAETKYVNELYDLQKIADDVYSFIAPESDSGVVQSNCTLIIGEDAAMVVDTGQFPSLADRMVADIRKLTGKPVRYIVNTHWHFDHSWGNAAFREAYPGVAIISTEFTRELIEDQGPKVLSTQRKTNHDQAAQMRQYVANGKLPDGRVVTEDIKRRLNRLADTLDYIDLDLVHTIHAPPTIGFEKELTINLGKREVKVMWLGRANTAGDAVVWIPDVKVLVTGDTVVAPTPFAFGSYMSEWPLTLQRMIELKAGTIVPGHGPVMHDDSYLKTLVEMFQELSTQVKRAVSAGLSLADTRKKVTLDDFKRRLAEEDSDRQLAFRSAFLYPAVDRAYQEATGKMKPEPED